MVLFSSVDMKPYSALQPIVMTNNVFFCYALMAKKVAPLVSIIFSSYCIYEECCMPYVSVLKISKDKTTFFEATFQYHNVTVATYKMYYI